MEKNSNFEIEAKENVRNSKYSDVAISGKLKEWYLSLISDAKKDTVTSNTNIMKKFSDYELKWKEGRDLYTFNRNEILDMLAMFSSSSISTLNVYLSIIRKYLDLAIEQGYLKTNINIADSVGYDDLLEIVNKTKKNRKIISKEDIYDMVEEKIANRQDQAILLLTFEGIKGKDCIELEQLKNDDIDTDKSTIKVVREGQELIVNIPRRLSNTLFIAKTDKEYQKSNGTFDTNKGIPTYDLIESEYFIRPTAQKNPDDIPYLRGKNIQFKMIKCLKDERYLDMSFITPTSLYLSGVINRLKDYSKEIGRELEHIDVVNFLEERKEKLNTYSTYLAYKDEITQED